MKVKKINKKSLFIFILLIAIISMDIGLILPNQVLIAAELGIDFASLGLMFGVTMFFAGVSTLIFGYLIDLYERKKLLILAGFLWSISSIFYIFVIDFWQIFLFRIIGAVATGVTTPVLFSYFSDVIDPDSRSKPFAYWGLIYIIASSTAGGFALAFNQIPTHLIDTESGGISERIAFISMNHSDLLHTWRYPFVILGIVALIVTVLAIFIVKEPKRAGSEKFFEDLSPDELKYSYRIKISDLKIIFQKKSNLFLILNFFDVIGQGVLFSFIFPLINLEMGISTSDIEGILFLLVVGIFGFLIGMFLGPIIFAHIGDKKVQSGDLSARVKVAFICSVAKMPLLLFAFFMSPNAASKTVFGIGISSIQVNPMIFWILWIIFSVLLGLGFAFGSGIGPNWSASLMDVNLSEHRGTMVSMASLVDKVGQSLGAIIGGMAIMAYDSIYEAVFWVSLLAGSISLCFWIPLLFTYDKDLAEVNQIMMDRAKEMKAKLPDMEKTTSEIDEININI
ncbi:MAG: MFS transporter [archaeon]|nr:MFS transporter [archaeon]